jgi:DNA replication and repair protein RecF
MGKNGSGKTSLLEAVYVVSTGRSFRTRSVETLINRHGSDEEFILFGVLSSRSLSHQVGIKKSKTLPGQIRVNKETIRSASQLAKLSPTILIDPLSFELLNGAPVQRRQFLDWGVFHVEHHFSACWNSYINCLKQRNSLLRNAKIDGISLSVWDARLAEAGDLVNQQRTAYFNEFKRRLAIYLDYFALDENIKIHFSKGWDKTKSLSQALMDSQEKDIERKFTQSGPHRADIKVSLYGQPAKENLSRGQQKLLIIALYLAQMQTLHDLNGRETVVLIDDVTAELDLENLITVFNKLLSLDTQVIVTMLNDAVMGPLFTSADNYKMFHVEHGRFEELQ